MTTSAPIRPADPARRRAIAGLGAGGAVLAWPGLARAQVDVGPPSRFSALAPSSEQVEQESAQQYRQMMLQAQQRNLLALPSHPQLQRLNYIADRLKPHTYQWNERARAWQWEINLIGSQSVNAFCMPGGKIAFYWGILTKLQLIDDEVAMIMGHEMTHALREHAREQMGKQAGTGLLAGIGAAIFHLGAAGQQLAGMGVQLANLSFSREDETEADLVGLEIASRAGYNPNSALTLWQKMNSLASNGAPPALLSDHPSNPDRMANIQRNIPNVIGLYNSASKPERYFGPPAGSNGAQGDRSGTSRSPGEGQRSR